MNVRLAFVSALASLALPLAAQAAPQLLGVISSAAPIPLKCESGVCSAELSAFCLEQGRSGPLDGTAYQAADGRDVTLIATLADGSVRRLPAARYLSIASARSYSAVTASVTEAVRKHLGARSLALAVGPQVTLVPVARAGDPSPVSKDEVAAAVASRQPLGADVFEKSHPAELTAVRLLNRVINALPRTGGGAALDLSAPDGLWDKVAGAETSPEGAKARGTAQAALVYESCRRGAHFVQGLTLRRCIEASHDALMSSLNEEIWRILGAGS
ncbi:MAG TPA: hypothetical protein VL244_13975 [Alphaproteobacteria bacterium]|nr:hypothetical protein [Alphaproteobacteria bacterium]